MKCPIDETVMIDYLEGCLEAGLAEKVRSHLEHCPVCRREYNELAAVRKVLSDSAGNLSDEPPESFWTESAQAVAEATYLQPARLEKRWTARFSRTTVYGALAAAAVLVLAITWLFQFESMQPGIKTLQAPAGQRSLAAVSPEEALLDSMRVLWQEMQEFELAVNALESYYALELEQPNGAAGEFIFSTGGSVYDGLQELNEEELQKVMFLVAGL